MSSHASHLYAFKDFCLDIRETVLLKRGEEVAITPKAFQLLSILVENHGAVVRKEKLISEIWADSIVEEGNLAFTARLLRKALGDNARTPIYIETIPRKGYRFIAEVSQPPSPEDVTAATAAIETRSYRRTRVLRIGLGLFVVLLATVCWFLLDRFGVLTRSAPILTESFKAERLSSTGNAALAVISPNGKLIAYTDQTGNGKWSIWLRQVATAENIQIVAPAEVEYGGIAFSRDSNSLFIARSEKTAKRLDIYRVNVFGGLLTKLVEGTEGWFSISPDGNRMSFVRCRYEAGDYCSLFVADIDGQNEVLIATRAQPIRIADNQFSTDGRTIAFAAGQSRTGSNDFGLYEVDLATGKEKEITTERFFNIKHLRWLPTGDDLLLTARPCAQQKFSIWKVSAATGEVTQLTRDDGNFSGLSFDDEARNLVVTKVDNNFSIYLEEVANRKERKMLAPGASCAFTPDGRIVFESKDLDIWIVDADGNNKRQLTSDASSDINPIVTADGKKVVFSSNRSGANHVWRMNIDGSDQKQVTQTQGGYPRSVTPDGRWVYYRAGISNALRRVDADSNVELELPEIEGTAHAVSPAGELVASFVREPGGKLNLNIWNPADRSVVGSIPDVDDDGAEPIHLQWSADGRSVVFVVKRSDEYELWRHHIDPAKRTLIAKLGSEPLQRVMLSPDGRSLAAVRGNWLHDAFLITGLKY